MLAICIGLAGCGGSAGGGSKGDLAAKSCDVYAKGQLGDKPYQLDLAALATSMKDQGDGSMLLTAPIVIEPGLTAESKQSLECQVRFTEGKELPDVIKMQFIW
ncbi:hypothetical protein N789_14380 [Arenimonas oryziterrae DSM 21050 = YC6267]|uniref:Uncharacterized protein n=1 Tax=Arenimonas oryziterrae DSM 21050 = YC6267 TaxID=1121015 RepID=A0A091ASX3_9GAMM|nr:hypothetical protein N789_14380 [Arenimonas oryziterrae DSM 21050 = YC6267]